MSKTNRSKLGLILVAALGLLLEPSISWAETQTYDCGYGDTYSIDTVTHQFTCYHDGAIQNCASAYIDGVYYYGLTQGQYPHRFFYPSGRVEILNIRPALQPGETWVQAENRGAWQEIENSPGVPACRRSQ